MQSSSLRGIAAMLAAVATFSVMDVTMKHLVQTYPAMQVTFLRGVASLPFLLCATGMFGRWTDLIPKRWWLHLVRGVLNVGLLVLFVYAVGSLSLADTYAIYMSGPLLITALSAPLLGEHIGWRRWSAVLIGLCGVLVVLRPTGLGLISLGGLAALASAACYAVSSIMIRVLARTDSGAAISFWAVFLVAVISGPLAIGGWVAMRWEEHWPWLLVLGLSGAFGQYFITTAFHLAAPPVIAPLEYTALMWGMLFDWLLWHTVPGSRMLLGATIIVGSGLYVIYREATLKRRTAAATTADASPGTAPAPRRPAPEAPPPPPSR